MREEITNTPPPAVQGRPQRFLGDGVEEVQVDSIVDRPGLDEWIFHGRLPLGPAD